MSISISDAGVQFSDASIQPSAVRPQIQSLPISLASNALTIAGQQYSLAFKTSLTSGAVATITGSPAALTIPAGATLGSLNGQISSLIFAVANNAGTLHVAVQNLAGGSDMSEVGLISTTAISTGANANNVWYSNTALTNVPYALIGRFDSTQAVAGQWVTTPSLVQGAGGNVRLTPSTGMIRLSGGNGHGSTNSRQRRFTIVVQNNLEGATYADSATLGASFTVTIGDKYTINYCDAFGSQARLGLSLNTTQPTVSIEAIPAAERLITAFTPAVNNEAPVSWSGYLPAGSVIRAHTSGAANAASQALTSFTMSRG